MNPGECSVAGETENCVYVDYYNIEGMGACKINFILSGKDVKYRLHSCPVSKTNQSDQKSFPAFEEVSKETRDEITETIMQFTGKDKKLDWVEIRIQVDDYIDEIINMGWCLPCSN